MDHGWYVVGTHEPDPIADEYDEIVGPFADRAAAAAWANGVYPEGGWVLSRLPDPIAATPPSAD